MQRINTITEENKSFNKHNVSRITQLVLHIFHG